MEAELRALEALEGVEIGRRQIFEFQKRVVE